MVLSADIPLPSSLRNERFLSPTQGTKRVTEKTIRRIAGLGRTTENVAHPSFRDLIRQGLPIALRGDKLNVDALVPGKSIGVEMGKGALSVFFIVRETPIHPQHLTTKIDYNSYFIRKNDPNHTLLNTRKYWKEGMDVKDVIFLSLSTIVDPETDGKSIVNAVRRKIIHGMNMIMLAGTLTQCSPDEDSSTSESAYISYESGIQTDIYVVEPGDTLSGICRKFGDIFTVSDLKALNKINSDKIYVDQTLSLPRSQYFQEIRTEYPPLSAPIGIGETVENSNTDAVTFVNQGNMEQIGTTDASKFVQMATLYNGYPYRVGGTGATPEAGIDCSQLIVNALIGTGCVPEGSDANTKTLQSMSHKIGTRDGQPGDFLIMTNPIPHIAIITENLGGGRYTTYDASPRKKIVCENTRVAGKSYGVYHNPFITGNRDMPRIENPTPETQIDIQQGANVVTKKRLAECSIKTSYIKQVISASKAIRANQSKYEEVERATGVPWQIIAVIHHREGSLDFKTVLHNGERIIGTDKLTKKVPAGHGPFATWAEGAIDSIKSHYVRCPISELTLDNANLLKAAEYLKSFNGQGYNNKAGGNPYLYAGLTAPEGHAYYTIGLYTKDRHYSGKTIDKRPGTIPILLNLLGGGNYPNPEASLVADSLAGQNTEVHSSSGNLNFTTHIRSVPVAMRREFLKEFGPSFGVKFADSYRGTASQNSTIASLLKKNRDFREKWEVNLLGEKNQSGQIASN